MTASRRLSVVFLFALLAPVIASAASTDFRVFFDTDDNSATGCAIGGMVGIEQVLVTVVEDDSDSAEVVQTHRLICTGGTFGPPTDINNTGWPAGFNGNSGQTTVETRIPFAAISGGVMPSGLHLGFDALRSGTSDSILTHSNGDPMIYPEDEQHGRRRSVRSSGPRVFVLDGQVADWQNINPFVTNASAGNQAIHLRQVFVYANPGDNFLYFRFEAKIGDGCVTPAVSIEASQTEICEGTNVDFTATPVNGGLSPIFQWTVNGFTVGSNSPNFSSATLNDGDEVAVTLTSSEECTTENPVTSNTIVVTVSPNPPTPPITPTPAQVCASFTGNTASGPAGAASYAWSISNGTITSATNIQNITYTAGSSGNVILMLVVTDTAGCSAENTVNVPINPNPPATITPNPAQVCANSTGNTASGPAGATTYAWSIVNGTITSATNIQNITYTAGASGTVELSLTVTNPSGCTASSTRDVPINANPAPPTITPNPAQVCANSTGNTAAGPLGATTYAWSIVNGTITSATNIQNITYTAGASGTVDLTLVVTNAAGCSATNTVNVTINANPAAPTITPNPAQVCANSTGNTADGPLGATTYAWSIVNGTITSAANIQTITYTAGASGTVDLTLVVTNAAGCSASSTVNVPINANPTSTITPTPAQVCANSTGNTAAGPAGMTTYAWSIVNGTITSATNIQNITYTAGASGTVDLTLVVTNASGCPDSETVNVPINANPTSTITPTPAQVCANSAGNTADGPAGATTYAWSIVNGTITSAANIQTITYTAGASGTVDLTLVVTNASGCSDSETVNVPINANPAVPTITPNPAQACANSTGNTADGPAGATTYAWSIVNGTITSATNIQTITYTAGASGTVDLTLVVTNAAGCSATNTVNVPINANPSTPTITPTPAEVCAGSTGNTADGPAGATTYAWSIVNGTITSATNIQTITYTAGASGTVDLTLVVTNAAGCSASNTVNVTINPTPTSTITPTPAQVCANSTGNTADGPAGMTTYAWSIVNGTITSATNIQTITYTAGPSGTVDLTLVVTNSFGCSDSETVNVPINANPAVPTITPTPAQVCANSTGNTADGPAGATTYAWSIVNGTITSATNIQTITYTAGASGTVDLTLVVTNAAGCSATNTVNVTINANPAMPTITPTPSTVCGNSTGNTADGPAGATTYAWSIVNGTITSAANIQTITYTAGPSGTVDLTLVVTNAAGCSASNTINVPISGAPATPPITPTPAQVCANSTGNTADGPAGATTYAWSIVNGTITSATNIQTITYTAGASGTVDLTLVVTNAAGCPASNTVNVPINANPISTITPTPAQVCANTTGNTADGPAGMTTYAWSIVNGTITSAANIQTITYTAGASGTVDLTLVVTNAAGCTDSETVNVPINANPAVPTITPTPAQVCAGSTGNTADGPAGATTYAWSIVNGTITSATNIQTITYTAGASGTVDLTLVVTNAAGCSASNTVSVTINPSPAPPTITPTPSPVCGGSTGNTASGPAGATTYAWSIVNGTITSATNIQNITYTAGASGTVDLTLVVTNASGCPASNTVNVPINPSPTSTITPVPAQVCANSTGNTAAGPAGMTTYAWSIVNGTITSAANIQNITYTAGASGTVDLTLVVTNASGCSDSETVNVPINASATPPTITPTPPQVCANSTGNTASGPAGATTYAWSIVNGTITSAANIQNITYTAGASGTVDLTLVVTNVSGCSASNTINVPINANPAAPTITPMPAQVCANSTGNSADGPAGATTYAWSIVNGTITSATNIQTITYTAGPSVTTVDLTLVVTNASGCSASTTINVPVNPSPATPTITPSSAEVCANTTGHTASGPAGATTYAWSIINGTITSATNIQNITWDAGATSPVTLSLTVTNASGCSASNSVNVPINPAVTLSPAPGAIPDAIYQNGYSQSFTASGGTPGFTYSISPGAPSGLSFNTSSGLLSGAAPTLPNAVGVFNFSVTATDSKGCSVTQSYSLTVRPKVVDDTYNTPNAVGNTEAMTTAYTPAPTTPKATYSGTLLDNDASNAAMTVTAGAACTSGTIVFNPNGNWLYTPAVGFTGTATCGYTVTSNAVTNTGNLSITFSNEVWYVRNNSAAGGDGRSHLPFDTLAEAESASGANDYIFVYFGNGTTSGQNAGIVLKAGQKLYGEGIALVVNTFTLVPAGSQPLISHNGAAGTVRATNIANVEVKGLNIASIANDAVFTSTTASSGSIEVANNTISSAALQGINADGGSGTLTLSIHDNIITSTGNGIDIVRTAGTVIIAAFDDNTVTGTSGASGIVITGPSVQFDSDNGTGGLQTVLGGNTFIGASGNGVAGGGLLMTSVEGDLHFSNLEIYTDNGTGLFATGTGTGIAVRVNTGGGNTGIIQATGGAAVSATSAALDLRLTNLTSTSSAIAGVTLTTVTGTLNAATGSAITNATGTDFAVSGGSVGIAYAGTITDDVGQLVSISTSTGTKTFSGAITDGNDGDGSGISLNANGAGIVTFSGGLTLSTGANAAFAATGTGTVNVVDPAGVASNRVTTTTGTAVNITNTIGTSGVTFESVNVDGNDALPVNGIILSGTGSGAFSVTGTGSGVTGGTIQDTSGDAISLTNVQNVSLSYMSITSNLGNGIRGATVNGFQVNNLSITSNGDTAASDEAGIQLTELTGTASAGSNPTSITNTTISNNFEFELTVTNTTGTLTNLTMSGNALSANGLQLNHGNLFNFQAFGTATMTLNLTSGTFTGNTDTSGGKIITATGVQCDHSGTGGTVTCNVSNATFTTNNVGPQGSVSGGGNVIVDFDNNNIQGSRSHGVNIFADANAPFTKSIQGRIRNNDIGTSGVTGSGSTVGFPIRVQNEGRVAVTLAITGNIINESVGFTGINVNHGISTTAGADQTSVTITGNSVNNVDSGRGVLVQHVDHTTAGLNAGNVCADIGANTFSNIAGQAGDGTIIRLRESANNGSGAFNVRQLQATGAVNASELDDANGVTLAQLSLAGTITYNAGACPQPMN